MCKDVAWVVEWKYKSYVLVTQTVRYKSKERYDVIMAFKNRGNTMNAMFTTNQYKVLEVMYDNTLSIADKEYCPLGQGEIADELGLSKAVVNKIFTELKEAGYISMVTRGKWKLSDGATEMTRITQRL